MGDVTDSIMEGILCEECGVYIDDNPQGFPRRCNDCKPKSTISDAKRARLRAKRKRKLKNRRESSDDKT
jgi:predicted Zn-ribbon and HTH transcriptional regulator